MIGANLSKMFNRALLYTFSKQKIVLTSLVLFVACSFFALIQGFVGVVSNWLLLVLQFLPFCFCVGLLLSLGIFLIRVYHNEVREKKKSFQVVFSESWKPMMVGLSFSFPLFLLFLLGGFALGLFLLISEVPFLGEFFQIVLAAIPITLGFFFLLLILLSLSILFFVPPLVSLREEQVSSLLSLLKNRLKNDLFFQVSSFLVGIIPIGVAALFFILSFKFSQNYFLLMECPLKIILRNISISLPIAFLIAPFIIFFFNFAAETYVYEASKKN